jgi:hypothetical protein
MITINELTNPERFQSRHWMGYQLADGRGHVGVSGIVKVDLHGQSSLSMARIGSHNPLISASH